MTYALFHSQKTLAEHWSVKSNEMGTCPVKKIAVYSEMKYTQKSDYTGGTKKDVYDKR